MLLIVRHTLGSPACVRHPAGNPAATCLVCQRVVKALSRASPDDGRVPALLSLPMSSSSKRSSGGGARILPPEVNRILYVRNLPFKISAAELYDIFGTHGAVRQIRVGVAPATRGTAYVVYEDIYDAKAAVERLSGFNVAGRYLIVRVWAWSSWWGGIEKRDAACLRTKSAGWLCSRRRTDSFLLAWLMGLNVRTFILMSGRRSLRNLCLIDCALSPRPDLLSLMRRYCIISRGRCRARPHSRLRPQRARRRLLFYDRLVV